MRALLVVNPKATTTTERGRDVLVRALGTEVDLAVAYTARRGHATELARDAAEAGVDLVVTLGGDGTVNEVVNGLMTARPTADDPAARPTADDPAARPTAAGPAARPALAVVPGGSTNVFARALGLPRDSTEGTGAILEALREGRERTIGLGMADDRYFTFCAGLGLDAAVVHRVERARLRGSAASAGLYVRSALRQYVAHGDLRQPSITLERPGEEPEDALATVIVQNTAPWTYLGDRPVHPNPDASFDTALDLLGVRALRLPTTARTVAQILARRPDPRGRHLLRLHDVTEFSLLSSRPQPFQLDGDYLGEREKVRFISVPAVLRVIC
jgi:diacylglycerol kinase family enzyme